MRGRAVSAGIWSRLKGGRRGLLLIPCLFILIWLAAAAVGGAYIDLNLDTGSSAPSLHHIMGTDALGRDMLARVIRGTFVSFKVGLFSTLLALVIGGMLGGWAGFSGGTFERIVMRVVDVLYCLPTLFFVILFTLFVGRNVLSLVLSLGLFSWMTVSRIARVRAAEVCSRGFVTAARAEGASEVRIFFRHIVPNIVADVLTYGTFLLPQLILGEAFLSFLGLGLQPPEASLGILIADGVNVISVAWWCIVFPAFALSFLMAVGYLTAELVKSGDDVPDFLYTAAPVRRIFQGRT